MSLTERIWRVSCRAAVCSEWASCSLLIPVSQCPPSSQALPKGGQNSPATTHTVKKPAFTRASIQRLPTGLRITGETICSKQGRASAPSSSHSSGCSPPLFSPMTGLADLAQLGCGWPWCPQGGVDVPEAQAWMPRRRSADSDMWTC